MFGFLLVGILLTTIISKRKNEGFIDFKEVLRTGMLFSLILAIILAFFNYVYHEFIAQDTIDFFISEAKKYCDFKKFTPEETQKYIDFQKSSFSSFRLLPPTLFGGLIVSLLTGALLQKSNPKSTENISYKTLD